MHEPYPNKENAINVVNKAERVSCACSCFTNKEVMLKLYKLVLLVVFDTVISVLTRKLVILSLVERQTVIIYSFIMSQS